MQGQNPIKIPIDGELDLHTFSPRDAMPLVKDYLEECRKKGILEVRIIHGKGKGMLKRTVESVLKRIPYVKGYRIAGHDQGHWGATIAWLEPL